MLQHTTNESLDGILKHLGSSYWLSASISKALDRERMEAWADAAALSMILKARLPLLATSAGVSRFGSWQVGHGRLRGFVRDARRRAERPPGSANISTRSSHSSWV